MEWDSDSPCHSHTYPGQERWSPGRHNGWELEFREQSWGEGCCWLWRDRLRACEGGDHAGKCWWRKARQQWKQGNTAESHVGDGAIIIVSLSPHASISSWTIERLAHQTHDALNYRVEPHPGCSFKWLMCQTKSRTPARGAPSMCLLHWTTEKDPRPGSL